MQMNLFACPRVPSALCAAIVTTTFMMSQPCRAETFEELKGSSIEVSFNYIETHRLLSNGTYTKRSMTDSLRFYVSQKGQIFDFYNWLGYGNSWSLYRLTTLDKAAEFRDGKMYTWTMIDGHLTRLQQLHEGLRVSTIVVDTRKLECQFAIRDEPDSQTGRIVPFSNVEVIGQEVTSYQCHVKRGNLFATDQ
jgi:hypothetical protein